MRNFLLLWLWLASVVYVINTMWIIWLVNRSTVMTRTEEIIAEEIIVFRIIEEEL